MDEEEFDDELLDEEPGEENASSEDEIAQAIEDEVNEQAKELAKSEIKALAKKGVVELTSREVVRSAFDDELANAELVKSKPLELNQEQQKAYNDIVEDIATNTFQTRLLYGITGSGKTEVYMQATQKVTGAEKAVFPPRSHPCKRMMI